MVSVQGLKWGRWSSPGMAASAELTPEVVRTAAERWVRRPASVPCRPAVQARLGVAAGGLTNIGIMSSGDYLLQA